MRRSVHQARLGAVALVLARPRRRRDVLYPRSRTTFKSSGSSLIAPKSACVLRTSSPEGRRLLAPDQGRRTRIADDEPPMNGRSGRKFFSATSWANAPFARFRKDASELYGDDDDYRRAAGGILARGAKPCRQSRGDRRGIRRTARRRPTAKQKGRPCGRPYFICVSRIIPRRSGLRARRRALRRRRSPRTW